MSKNIRILSRQGYTLIEMSMVLAIIAVVVIGVYNLQDKASEHNFHDITAERMQTIQTALHDFILKNHYLPCPSAGGLAASDTNFGESVTSVTADLRCNINNTDIGNGIDDTGMVPTRTLGLSEQYAYDAWGQAFIYRLSQGMMDEKYFLSYDYRGDIIVQDTAGVELTSLRNKAPYNFGAAYIILSHGASGIGQTWSVANPSGTRTAATGLEAENSNHFLNRIYTKSKHQEYDDILVYDTKERYLPTTTAVALPHYVCENARRFRLYPLDESSPPANVLTTVASGLNTAARIADNICRSYKPKCDIAPSNYNDLIVWLDGNDPNGNGTTGVTGPLYTWVNKADGTKNATNGLTDAPDLLYNSSAACGYGRSCISFGGNNDQYYKIDLSGLFSNDFTIFTVSAPNRTGSLRKNHLLSIDLLDNPATTNESFMFGDFVNEGIFFDMYNRPVSIPNFEDPFKRKIVVVGLNPNAGLETGLKIWGYNEDAGYLMAANPNSAAQLTSTTGIRGRIGNLYNGYDYDAGGGYVGPSSAVDKYNNSSTDTINSMYLHEVLVYNRALSDDERMAVVSYLSKKWLQQQCE